MEIGKNQRNILYLDTNLNKIQQNSRDIFQLIKNNPLLKGRLIENVTIATGGAGTPINHGLGVTPIGWIITTRRSNGVVWQLSKDDRILTLRSSASVNIDVWVF